MKRIPEQPVEKPSLKQINRSSIYKMIYENPGVSRQDIAAALKLSLPTVIKNVEALLGEGLIQETGFVDNTGGRKAVAYGIASRRRVAIGLDLTRTHITAVAVDLTGQVIFKLRLSCPFAYTDGYFQQLGQVVRQLIEEGGLEEPSILGVGIGLPGLVTADHSTVFYGEILKITGATRDEFSKYIPFPTLLFNDANAAAFAETWKQGDINNAFYVMLSNNVGGAVYIRNQVYPGERLESGEVGHIPLVPKGKRCYCGQRGCMDAYCAATVLSGLTNGDLGEFFRLVQEGAPEAAAAWDTYLHYLADAVSTLHKLFDCTIILGGYVGEYIGQWLEPLRSLTAKKDPFSKDADYLIACRYKTEAIAAGAALNFIQDYLREI